MPPDPLLSQLWQLCNVQSNPPTLHLGRAGRHPREALLSLKPEEPAAGSREDCADQTHGSAATIVEGRDLTPLEWSAGTPAGRSFFFENQRHVIGAVSRTKKQSIIYMILPVEQKNTAAGRCWPVRNHPAREPADRESSMKEMRDGSRGRGTKEGTLADADRPP
jgi:hypothetical protein